jgi:molybdenum cofactor cytidylyltransferase
MTRWAGTHYDLRVVPAMVLAAGKSTRMGRTKALLPVGDNDTFLTRIIRSFRTAGVEDVVVVLGHDADAIISALDARGVAARIVVNADYERGQFSSLLAGLQVVDRPGVSGMLLTLVDVPLVSPETIRAVVARHRATAAPLIRPVSGDRHGHPVLIDRRLFEALRHADPIQGAKPVVRANASAAGDVEVNDEGAFLDVDTPEDYAALTHGG